MGADRVAIISAVMPAVLAILAGIGWIIQHRITTATKPPAGVEITQGQTVPMSALPDYLRAELDECEAEAQAYRDALIRANVDPDRILRDAGLRATTRNPEERP